MQREARTCPVCGTKFFATADREFCPVCILRGATGGESATTREPGSVSGSADSPGKTQGASQARRFEHYEVMLDEDGRLIELGRGAMGVTYKAFDVDLHCPVTLKVISERYLGDESVRLRFLREARAAASVRHPNVASVFHLGQNRRELLLRDGVCRGRNARKPHQTFRPAGGKAGARNYDPGGCRIGRSSRTEACPPRYQANKHHGEVEGGRRV